MIAAIWIAIFIYEKILNETNNAFKDEFLHHGRNLSWMMKALKIILIQQKHLSLNNIEIRGHKHGKQ